MNAMAVQDGYVIVSVRSTTPQAARAIKQFGNQFWLRPIQSNGVMLIPIVNGIPRVADFIIVPYSEVIYGKTVVGYGA